MSSACITSATATSTTVFTTDVVTTSFSTSVSTGPPTTTTITSDDCVLASISDLPCLSTPTVFTSTIAGNVTTVSVPITTTVVSTETQIVTLFGSSCPIDTTVASSSSIVSSSSSSSSPSQITRGSSLSASLSTPPPVTFESSVPVTLGNGQVSVVEQTFTSQPPASTVYVPLSTSGLVAQTNDDHSSQIGPIVGGVLGGFFGLISLVLILWYLVKRRRRWDDIFDKEDSSYSPGRRPTKRWSLDADMDPKPYQYGLVGQTSSPSLPSLGISSALESPPHTSGVSPSSQLPRTNTHNLPPLLTPTSASTPGLSATTLSSRPSTAGSMLPSSGTHKPTSSDGSSTHISPAVPSQWGHHSPSPSTDQAYLDHPERSGSPTSMREWEPQRRLQLVNLGDDESITSPITPSASALNGGKAQRGHGRINSSLSGILVDTAP
ncbi:hypothetical protein MSAN_01054900 [Mycena sanguinolenta]|uniref:Uncharacterized protein n=1 Tax=Mycena sanguinolenta TaxID=230812 RepID=A0A8H6YU77_9AGAR|nr:hypothetical protein MSAN_01054900 [Mycena sanguinolenta]